MKGLTMVIVMTLMVLQGVGVVVAHDHGPDIPAHRHVLDVHRDDMATGADPTAVGQQHSSTDEATPRQPLAPLALVLALVVAVLGLLDEDRVPRPPGPDARRLGGGDPPGIAVLRI